MFDVRVRDVMARRKLVSARPGTPVARAAKLMAAKGVGALLVVERGELLGIFTERDALMRVIAPGLDPRTTSLADVMTRAPKTIGPQESFGRALLVMHENNFRHLPVVEDGVPVGIISARYALDPDLEEFTSEVRRREYLGAANRR
jgi:CBS domain-containing protein